jgi:hypothetical protein
MMEMSTLWLKQKPIKILIVIALALFISAPIVYPQQVLGQNDEYYSKSFAWDYNGEHWTWNLSIPKDLYEAYKAVPTSTRTRNGPAGYGFLTTTQDYYIQTLAQKLNETTNELGYNSFDQVNFVLAFVQSLPYTSDSVTTGHDEYPRFPIETLVDDGGDCEDTSVLFASLTLIMGYGTVYINPPNHYAVGILGNDLKGTYWTYQNKTYYYCETTGNGFKIGQLPDEFQGQTAYIYGIDESKQFVPYLDVLPTSNPNPTDSTSPTVTGPTVQPVLPLSFNLISGNPLLFIIIIFAVIVSIALAVWSVRKTRSVQSKEFVSSQPGISQVKTSDLESNKFCVYCGSINKIYAVYCEKCGKKQNITPSAL